MTPIPLPLLDGDTFICDNSTLEYHQTCPRAAQYGICHRRKAVGSRIALSFGGTAHKCLEHRYRHAGSMLEQTDAIEKDMIAIAEKAFTHIDVPPDDFRTLDRMIDLVHKYGERYRYEDFELVTLPNGDRFVEVPFAHYLGTIPVNTEFWVQDLKRDVDGSLVKCGVPYRKYITNIRVVWQGRIDLAYRYSGGLYIMDHKTASIATNMAEFQISNQFYGYVWSTEEMLHEPVTGFVINRMVCRKPTRTGDPFTFERKPVPVQRGLVTEWKTDCLYMIADFIEMVRRQSMPKHTVWCVGKFGTCQFHQVCQNDNQEQRDFLVLESGEYADNTWSPLKNDVE